METLITIKYMTNMNWTFNQNCQLIISECPNKGEFTNSFEIIVDPDGIHKEYHNRTNSIIEFVKDGLYQYYLLLTNRDLDDINFNDVISNNNSIGDWSYSENIFSICNLRKCAFELEKKSIESFLCYNTCEKSSSQLEADLLLISIFVLEHLISLEKYSEAERILERLKSCENICGNTLLKPCNCNG